MKQILLISALLGISITYLLNIDNQEQSNIKDFPLTLRYLASDSLLQMLEGKSFLFFYYGVPNGLMWSLIYRDGESYHINIDAAYEKTNSSQTIDTITLVNDYKDLIQWGIDSLPILANNMIPCSGEDSSWL